MTYQAKIESFHFTSEINTISQENYPDNYPMHWHQYAEFIAVTKKDAPVSLTVNQKKLTLQYGDILMIWPGELHEIHDNKMKSIIALQFPMSIINSRKELALYFDLYRDFCHLHYTENTAFNTALIEDFEKLLALSCMQQTDPLQNVRMTIVLYEMFIRIATHFTNREQDGQTPPERMIDEKVQYACAYITAHCEEALTLETVAEEVGFSPCYFSRHFKKITTHSFVEYLALQRIGRLQVYLGDPNLSITEAAFKAGFKSIPTLNRTFSKYCGISPREFRKFYLG